MAATLPTIAVMGTSGSGKSSLIRAVTKSDEIVISQTLRSDTKTITSYQATHGSTTFLLLDTPGFDNNDGLGDRDVLESILAWSRANSQSLAGIVILHPITETRLKGSAQHALRLIDKLCGFQATANILLLTTFWDQIDHERGHRRQKDLASLDGIWKNLVDRGCKVRKASNDYDRFTPVLADIARRHTSKLKTDLPTSGQSIEIAMSGLTIGEPLERITTQPVQNTQPKTAQQPRAASVSATSARPPVMSPLSASTTGSSARTTSTIATPLSATTAGTSIDSSTATSPTSATLDAELASEKAQREEFLRKLRDKHEAERQARIKELEEDAKRAAEQQAELDRFKQEQKLTARRLRQESAAKTLYRGSMAQRDRVDAAIDRIRYAHHARMLPQEINGIQAYGKGMALHAGSNQLSVTRTPLNIWCDSCRTPIGVREGRGCATCELSICLPCHSEGRGCHDRDHILTVDRSALEAGLWSCSRAMLPHENVDCDKCRKPLTGLFLHCCICNDDDFDICVDCVVNEGLGCNDHNHKLSWAVQRIELPRADQFLAEFEEDDPQQTFTGQPFKPTAVYRWHMASRMQKILNKYALQMQVEQRAGRLRLKAGALLIPGYCDHCLFPIFGQRRYECTSCAWGSFWLCSTCFVDRRARCLNTTHAMVVKLPTHTSTCTRETTPFSAFRCDAIGCGKTVQSGPFFHCCICNNDDYDICVNCAFQGKGCQHLLKSSFIPHPYLRLPPP